MDPNAERGLATAIFIPDAVNEIDDELKLVRGLYMNARGPSTQDDIATYFGILKIKSPIFLVTFDELRRRGIVEAASLGGRDYYDLTKEFRDLVDLEFQKYQSNICLQENNDL